MNLAAINAAPPETAREMLLRCCGSRRWAEAMIVRRPFASESALISTADEIWQSLDRAAWLEAFSAHPRIGDFKSLREKFASTADFCRGEQAGMSNADENTLRELGEGNRRYEERFGYIFIVCATGKTAAEMLAILNARRGNDAETELSIAAAEQAKITRLRLEEL
jgi:OHCU decarboxylase